MEWTQFIIMLSGIMVLFLWNRAEARADARNMDAKIDLWRNQTHTLLTAINQEIKDFHGRLCAIEERSKNKG